MNATNKHRERTQEERDYYALSKRAYTIFGHVYDAAVFPFQRLRHEVASMVDLGAGSRLLDVATGTGQQAFAFAEKACEVVAIDLSEAMLRIARKRNRFPNVTFQQGDAANLPFDEGSFDATCISFALHEMRAVSATKRFVRWRGSPNLEARLPSWTTPCLETGSRVRSCTASLSFTSETTTRPS